MRGVNEKSRYLVILATGFVLGSLLVSPVTAHIGRSVAHLWNDHIKPRLSATGEINDSSNPVNWDQLMNVPAGIADGEDATQDDEQPSSKRTHVITHVFDTKGNTSKDPFAVDMEIHALYRRGVVGGCGGGNFCPGATVELRLYDDAGAPLRGAGAAGTPGEEVCNPCTMSLSSTQRKRTLNLDDLITAAGGFGDRQVVLGFAVITVSGGDPDAVSIQGFVVNSHANAFELSVLPFHPDEVSSASTD